MAIAGPNRLHPSGIPGPTGCRPSVLWRRWEIFRRLARGALICTVARVVRPALMLGPATGSFSCQLKVANVGRGVRRNRRVPRASAS